MVFETLLLLKPKVDDIIEMVRTSLRDDPRLHQKLGSIVFPDSRCEWHVESRYVRMLDDSLPEGYQDTGAVTRFPAILVSEGRERAVAVEISASRYCSFRLSYLEKPLGFASFRKDYDLPVDVEVRKVSITIDDDELMDVRDYRRISVRNEAANLWTQLQTPLDELSHWECPELDRNTGLLDYLSAGNDWLDLVRRIDKLCRSAWRYLHNPVFWHFEYMEQDSETSELHIREILVEFPRQVQFHILSAEQTTLDSLSKGKTLGNPTYGELLDAVRGAEQDRTV
jgi:hypothetical protein